MRTRYRRGDVENQREKDHFALKKGTGKLQIDQVWLLFSALALVPEAPPRRQFHFLGSICLGRGCIIFHGPVLLEWRGRLLLVS